MNTSLAAATLALAGLCATGAQAITFDFEWFASSSPDTTDATMQAVGKIDVDVDAGDSFSFADVLSIDIEVSGATIPTFYIGGGESITIFDGAVASDGLSATLNDFFFGGSSVLSFGCDFASCEQGIGTGEDYNIVSGLAFTNTSAYGTAQRALASFSLTKYFDPVDPDPIDNGPGLGGGDVTPVPLPAGAPLLLGGLGVLALLRRRKA